MHPSHHCTLPCWLIMDGTRSAPPPALAPRAFNVWGSSAVCFFDPSCFLRCPLVAYALFRTCPALFMTCPAVFRTCPALFKTCPALFRTCPALWVFFQNQREAWVTHELLLNRASGVGLPFWLFFPQGIARYNNMVIYTQGVHSVPLSRAPETYRGCPAHAERL